MLLQASQSGVCCTAVGALKAEPSCCAPRLPSGHCQSHQLSTSQGGTRHHRSSNRRGVWCRASRGEHFGSGSEDRPLPAAGGFINSRDADLERELNELPVPTAEEAAAASVLDAAPARGAASVSKSRPAQAPQSRERGRCLVEAGSVKVRDDLALLIEVLPADIRGQLIDHPRRAELLEVVLDLGRRPEARFLGDGGGEYLRKAEVTRRDLESATEALGEFGGDNRAGVEGTLHRISAIRNRKGGVVGLTCRVGRAVTGHIDMIQDVLNVGQSILFLGRPGVGKTTVIREMARVLADDLHKRVVIVDTSNEIGGDGDVPHPAIGGARRMQVPDPSMQHKVMVEAVENHMPEIVIVDEIGTEAEALACRTIAERGVQLVGTAHGQMLENLIKNPTLADLVGGIHSVTLGDDEARARGTQKTVLERKGPPTFPMVIEMRERSYWVAHQTDRSVDSLLHGKRPTVEVRTRDAEFKVVVDRCLYDSQGNGKLDHDFDYVPSGGGNGGGASVPSNLRTRSSSSSNSAKSAGSAGFDNDMYAWAARIGHVPDKEVLAELAMQGYSGSNGGSTYGYYSRPGYSTTPGRRGTRRGKYNSRWED